MGFGPLYTYGRSLVLVKVCDPVATETRVLMLVDERQSSTLTCTCLQSDISPVEMHSDYSMARDRRVSLVFEMRGDTNCIRTVLHFALVRWRTNADMFLIHV